MQNKRILTSLVIIILLCTSLTIRLLNRSPDTQYFHNRLHSINKVTVRTMSDVGVITEQDSQLLENVITEHFNNGDYQREKGRSLKFIPVGFWVQMANGETLTIGYSPQTKQLFFESFWFIAPALNQSEVGEYAFKTKDMFLTVNDDIDELLQKYDILVE